MTPPLVPGKMTSGERGQKFHTHDELLPSDLNASTNEKNCPDLGGDTSSVSNFCACFSDVIGGKTSGGVGCFLMLQT